MRDIDALAELLSLPTLPSDATVSDPTGKVCVEVDWVQGRLVISSEFSPAVISAADNLLRNARPDLQGSDAASTLYERARSAYAAEHFADAIGLLCSLLIQQTHSVDALLGLAICAIRMKRYDEAYTLAQDYLARGFRHPRAFCVLGLSDLMRGNRAEAREHLAMATRMGRLNPEFRDDMRLGQKLLLLLHLSG